MTLMNSWRFFLLLLGLVFLFGVGEFSHLRTSNYPLLWESQNRNWTQPGASGGGGVSKADLEKLIAAAAQTAPAQTIRIEQGPIKIAGEPPVASAVEPKKES